MKEVILHIGMHKTGSSTIQRSLKGYSDGTTRIASFPFENHSIPMYTIYSQNRCHYHIWKNKNLSNDEIYQLKNNFLNILEKDLSDPDYDRLIISGEDMCHLDQQDVNLLINQITSKGLIVKVIVFVRSPLSYIVSNIQERIKHGLHFQQISPSYKNKICKFRDIILHKNLHVIDYDNLVKKNIDIIKHFSKIASIDLPIVKSVNLSLSREAVALIHKLNSIQPKVIEFLETKQRITIRTKIYHLIMNIFHMGDGNKLDKEQFRYLIKPEIKDDCEWLKKIYGITYNDDIEYNLSIPDNLDNYFDSCLEGNEEKIRQLFGELGCEFDRSISIEKKFLEAFVALSKT